MGSTVAVNFVAFFFSGLRCCLLEREKERFFCQCSPGGGHMVVFSAEPGKPSQYSSLFSRQLSGLYRSAVIFPSIFDVFN